MDSEKSENKAKLMKKRSVHVVHEHFEEVLTPLSGFSLFVQWSRYEGNILVDKYRSPRSQIIVTITAFST